MINKCFYFMTSSIGKKILMSFSGIVLFGFLLGHLVGNLQIFVGKEAINAYAAFLKGNPGLLWGTRLTLLLMVIIHIITSIKLVSENKAARPVAYAHQDTIKATYASRLMPITGIILLAYIIYHLLHFTVGSAHHQFFEFVDAQGRHDVYKMMVTSFQQWPISIAYILAMFALCFHLSHALASVPQTLGINNDRLRTLFQKGSVSIAWIMFLGYASIPLSVLFNIVE